MKNEVSLYSLLIIIIVVISCVGGGTHGSIKDYQYNVSKQILEKTVQSVIKESRFVKQDSIRGNYNNDTAYVTIHISYGKIENEYTFRYGGDKGYWDTSKISDIFIAYAYNKEKTGGSVGHGDIKWYNYKLKKELIEPFERELVSKIDSELAMKHTEGE